jgi:hypothetical protein
MFLSETATACTLPNKGAEVSNSLPSAAFQTRSVLSVEPEMTLVPSLLKTSDVAGAV